MGWERRHKAVPAPKLAPDRLLEGPRFRQRVFVVGRFNLVRLHYLAIAAQAVNAILGHTLPHWRRVLHSYSEGATINDWNGAVRS